MSEGRSERAASQARRPQSRREFLARGAAMVAGVALADLRPVSAQQRVNRLSDEGGPRRPLEAHVVKVGPDRLMPLGTIQQSFLRNGLHEGLCRLTGRASAADAWHHILKPEDKILIKFNQAGAAALSTSVLVATTLVESLTSAGWAPEKITLLEVNRVAAGLRGTQTPDMRWQGRVVDFGVSGSDSFVAAIDQASAIINVPFLKTHHLTTMTCSLKNLSHGLIRHPARFHANGCDPAIGEIVASDSIRSKLRLNIVNAMRIVFQGGPVPQDDCIHTAGILLLSPDPVACDAIGYNVLSEARALRGLVPLLAAARLPHYLGTAGMMGLGQWDAERITVDAV